MRHSLFAGFSALAAVLIALQMTWFGPTSELSQNTGIPSRFAVVGYAEAGSTPAKTLSASSDTLTTVGVDGINVTADGAHLSPVSTNALSLLAHAHALGRNAELLVGNFDGATGDFSAHIGDALLGSPTKIAAVATAVSTEVARNGWDGVTIDLESLSGRYPAALTRLVSELRTRLGAEKSISICLMATADGYRRLGYDLAGLGRVADHVVLMAYDQHGPTWTKAGPVGGTPWVKVSLAPLLDTVPREKIQLGVAGYGYTWPKKGTGRQLSDAAARSLVLRKGAVAKWDARQQEWHAILPDGTALWWSDSRTFDARVALARAQHLGGVAVWSLALSDPLHVKK